MSVVFNRERLYNQILEGFNWDIRAIKDLLHAYDKGFKDGKKSQKRHREVKKLVKQRREDYLVRQANDSTTTKFCDDQPFNTVRQRERHRYD